MFNMQKQVIYEGICVTRQGRVKCKYRSTLIFRRERRGDKKYRKGTWIGKQNKNKQYNTEVNHKKETKVNKYKYIYFDNMLSFPYFKTGNELRSYV